MRSGIRSVAAGPSSTIGDVLAAFGTAVVLISMLLTWYRVTITSAGMQYLEALERAFFPRLFPAGGGLGGLTGPLTTSVSALGKGAGGWRWAIVVVSSVLLLEFLLAISSGATSPSSPSGSHTTILLLLTVINLILVAAAFITLPFGGTPAAYLTVARGMGAYVGLFAGLVACAGAVARLVRSSTSA